MRKKDGRSISRETLEYLRNQSIKLWKKSKSIEDISEFCGVHFTVVYKWIRVFNKDGWKGLKRRKAKGAEPKLNNEDKIKIISWLKKSAMEFEFETPLWDCKRVQTTIKKKLNKSISISNLWKTLRRWGLTPQKPEKEALEKNPVAVRKWLNEEWPKIEKHRRRWQAMLYFQDESGVSLIPVLGKTWAPKGKTPKIKVTGNKGGLCVTSAISPVGRMVFRIENHTIHAEDHIDFLKQIMKYHPHRKIIVIEDNAPPHIAGLVKDFVDENKNKIAVYYLPTYSPDLNPDEKVWKYLKNVKLKAHQARNKKEFKPLVQAKMQSIQKRPKLIKSFFNGNILF
ncbi:MAG: IS630 family transposase [Nanoarchaeota archaeon]|nr:IS630 family transposase [Nanoarchaeota archaeon]